MKMIWIIDCFDKSTVRLKDYLKNNSDKYDLIYFEDNSYLSQSMEKTIRTINTPCIVHGCIDFCKYLSRFENLYPGVMWNKDNYKCSKYYPFYHDIDKNILLNNQFILLPYSYFKSNIDEIFEYFKTNSLFIRPDRSDKIFTGTTIHKNDKNIDEKFELIEFYDFDKNELILISPCHDDIILGNEYRIIVTENKIITGSSYSPSTNIEENIDNILDNKQHKLTEFVYKIIDMNYNPDLIYVIDICELDKNWYFLNEVGSISMCGLYKCNIEKFVINISEILQSSIY